jgi:exodeoxyribonuclease VII large subunit
MRLDHLLARLSAQRPQARLARADDRLRDARRRLGLLALGSLERATRHLAQAQARLLARDPRARLVQDAMRLQAGHVRLRTLAQAAIDRPRARVVELGRALHAVSPLATLDRGYAILLTTDGRVVRSAGSVAPGTPLRARLADGELGLSVTDS